MCSAVKTLLRKVQCGHLFGHYRRSPELQCGSLVSGAGNGKAQRPIRVTVIEGQGTGPVVLAAVRKIFKAALVPVEWDYQTLSVYRDHKTNRMTVNPQLLDSAIETGLVLCAKDSSPRQNDSLESDSLALHKALNAFVGVRKFNSVVGHEPYGPINLVNIREHVSGEYSEIEHLVSPGVVQSIKTVSKKISVEVAKLAFDYACKHGHSRITVLHKADVMRLSDGIFLKACREVSACYPDVEYNEEKLDSFCLNVTTNPGRYEVLLTTSLYGAFAGSVCGMMSGGLVTVPTIAYGPKATVFSTMGDYGYSTYSHSDGDGIFKKMVYGQEQIINPTGIIRAAALMLDHAGMVVAGRCIAAAVEDTIRQGIRTQDMGGDASCSQFTDAIIKNLKDSMPNGCEECGQSSWKPEICNRFSEESQNVSEPPSAH
eukprot:XP_001943134.2 PREDICTED: isocitrate dehydrogenase [NAD] subunit alpha, mitochondrial-like [Acyrthosiphon pisum]